MARSAAELARRAVEHWSAGDMDAMCADWDPSIVMRPDARFPDAAELVGEPAARRFAEEQREFLGPGQLEVLEEHELKDRCLVRVRQEVHAPASGVVSSYDWSFLATARAGKIMRVEFFIEREQGLAAAGIVEHQR